MASFAGAKALVIVFWCNHCPYVRAYEKRFVEWADGARKRGVGVAAINSELVKHRYLPDAVDALLVGKAPPVAQSWAIGCSIKWG